MNIDFFTSQAKREVGETLELSINGESIVFRYAPPGTFLMGSAESEAERYDDETQFEATLSQGFYLSETPVTQALWKATTGKNPSAFKGKRLPVEQVSWNDCAEFVKRLNADCAPKGLKFDFPTEAEWEYACRAGTTTPFNFGERLNGDKANCDGFYPYGTETEGRFLRKTSSVKSYEPNAWGFYDMHGNVWEWCKDEYGAYPTNPTTDPKGARTGSDRVIRGGSWYNAPGRCRSARRDFRAPSIRSSHIGFRLALRPTWEFEPGTPLDITIGGLQVVFRYIPSGKFLMGSPETENRYRDETQREITLSHGFFLLETPVTQALWKVVNGKNPSEFVGDDLPVEQVSWDDCAEFVKKLNEGDYLPAGLSFDFPSEAEWEYACRAGTTTPFYFGSRLNGDKANCNGESPYGFENVKKSKRSKKSKDDENDKKGLRLGKTSPVKSYEPNAWGLYDMSGNVREWCKDWSGEYPTESETDPTGPTSGSERVLRGGSWDFAAKACRSASRDAEDPSSRSGDVGFRLALRTPD